MIRGKRCYPAILSTHAFSVLFAQTLKGRALASAGLAPGHLVELVALLDDGTITRRAGQRVVHELVGPPDEEDDDDGTGGRVWEESANPSAAGFEFARYTPGSVRALVNSLNLAILRDSAAIRAILQQAMAEEPDARELFLRGDAKMRARMERKFIGEVIKRSGGRADPQVVGKMVRGWQAES